MSTKLQSYPSVVTAGAGGMTLRDLATMDAQDSEQARSVVVESLRETERRLRRILNLEAGVMSDHDDNRVRSKDD